MFFECVLPLCRLRIVTGVWRVCVPGLVKFDQSLNRFGNATGVDRCDRLLRARSVRHSLPATMVPLRRIFLGPAELLPAGIVFRTFASYRGALFADRQAFTQQRFGIGERLFRKRIGSAEQRQLPGQFGAISGQVCGTVSNTSVANF